MPQGPHFPFLRTPGPQAFCSSILAEEAGLGFLLVLSREGSGYKFGWFTTWGGRLPWGELPDSLKAQPCANL